MDMKAVNNSGNKSSFDAEKSQLEKMEAEIKSSTFGVLFVLLKDEDTSIVVAFFFALIQFLQISLFAFHENVGQETTG